METAQSQSKGSNNIEVKVISGLKIPPQYVQQMQQ